MRPFIIHYLLCAGIGLVLLSLPAFSLMLDGVCQGLAYLTFHLAKLLNLSIILEHHDTLRYQINGFAIVISHECSGVSSIWMLSAAILVFPAPWKFKIFGVFLGILVIQILNILRLISLVYFGQFYIEWFETIHEQLWPLLLYFTSLVCFALWFNQTPSHYA